MNINIRYMSMTLVLLGCLLVYGHPYTLPPLVADDDGRSQLTVVADPLDGGSVSGGGTYTTGQTVNLRASAAAGFVFTGWTKADGTEISSTANFTYTKQEGDEVLTAHFRYDPNNPDEPVTPVFPDKKPTHAVTIVAEPADGGSVSGGNNALEEGAQTRLRASAASSFQFTGWYVADTLYNTSADFYYTMGEEDILFEARFVYNPNNPDEPSQPDIPFITPDYKVSVTVSPADGGSASTERSTMKEGERTRLRASAASSFQFIGWYVADTLYNTTADFYYTMEKADIVFEARFVYDPSSPNEPPQPDIPTIKPKYQVTAEAVPADGGSVSVGTSSLEEGQISRLSASVASGFVFLGWYANDSLYSTATTYNYTMEKDDIHFEGRFNYNPGSPAEPSSPDTHRYELFLTTVHGLPGRTIQYPLYLNALDTLKDMHFQLNFPEGTTPNMENVRLSGKAVGYTMTYEKVGEPASVRRMIPSRAGEEKITSYAISLTGGTTPPCNTRLLTIDLELGEDFSGEGSQQVSITQISMTDTEGNTETASARHGSLVMREASELGNIFYLTINSTGFGNTRVGSKNIRNSVQVIDFVENSSVNVYFVPDNGYHLSQVLKGGEDVTSQVVENRLFIENIQDDISLEVTFAEGTSAYNPLTITATGNGTVTYGTVEVKNGEEVFDVSYGAEVVLTISPEKGYHIESLLLNGENALSLLTEDGKLTIESMTASASVSVTFAPNVHDVTFRYGETIYQQTQVAYGETITVPDDPKLKGHTFAGWDKPIPETMPDSALVFTALFTINQYMVTFTIPSEEWTKEFTLVYGAAITIPDVPQKPGYTFAGWDKPVPETMPDSALVFTGSYTQNLQGLTLIASGNGMITYGETSVRSSSQSFDVAELSDVVLTITPDAGYHVETLTINGEDALSQMIDGKLNIGSMTASVTVAVTFANNSDLNNDGLVDVGDIMTIINYIADDIYNAPADLNNDKSVDVGDIMVVINTIIGTYDNSAGVKAMSDMADAIPATENNDCLTISNEDNIVSIQLDNEFEYSAFQMIVTVPNGVDIDDVIFNSDRLDGFTKFAKKVNERQYIIIGFSMDGNVITGSAGKILSLSITGNADDNIIISDPIFSIPDAKSYKLRVDNSFTTNLQDIQVAQISVRGNTVYVHANNDTTLNIYSVSGALCERKRLHPGVNVIPLRRGQYIINNHKVTITK